MTVVATRPEGDIPVLRVLREATPAELASWDARVVDVPGGDVHQSVAWGLQRERAGAQPHHLVLDDGSFALVLGRQPRIFGGGRAYVPRGPVAAGADARAVAGRLARSPPGPRTPGSTSSWRTPRSRPRRASRRS